MGLIDQAGAAPAPDPSSLLSGAGAAPAPGADPSTPPGGAGGPIKLTPDAVMSQLHLQPAEVPQVQRIVVAGMKVMFDAKTHDLLLKQIDGPGSMPQKLGQGIAGLMGLLYKESQNSIPPKLIIPAGIVLLAHAADYLAKSGQPVTDQDIAGGIHMFVSIVMRQFGIDPNKIAAMGANGIGAPQGGAQPPADPNEPDADDGATGAEPPGAATEPDQDDQEAK